MSELRPVVLYGHLRRRFGREFRLAVSSPAEAIRALCAVVPGFREHLLAHSAPGYRVITSDVGSTPRERLHEPRSGVYRIVPVVAGAGGKTGALINIILGTVLVAATFYFAPFLPLGLSLIAGGVAQLLTPTPQAPTAAERPENAPSFAFDGAVNVSVQGAAVPIAYGEVLCGSVVVSSGISTERLPT